MTPKEKAKKLTYKFKSLDVDIDWFDILVHDEVACALICVENIIEELNSIRKIEMVQFDNDPVLGNDRIEYWEEVKKELEKL